MAPQRQPPETGAGGSMVGGRFGEAEGFGDMTTVVAYIWDGRAEKEEKAFMYYLSPRCSALGVLQCQVTNT